MNIYEKLNAARVAFQSRGVKMSGKNDFARYSYFELADILPAINEIAESLKFTCVVTFSSEKASLVLYDTEKPENSIAFTSPMSTASLKGCHEVQNLGAVETYIKRYLYQNAFEIVESDALNGIQGMDTGKPEAKPQAPETKPSEFVAVKSALIDYLELTPPVFTPEQMNYANEMIKANNLAGMKTALDKAKSKVRKA